MKELKMYIDGRFIENQSDKWIDVLNPSTEEVISKMPGWHTGRCTCCYKCCREGTAFLGESYLY